MTIPPLPFAKGLGLMGLGYLVAQSPPTIPSGPAWAVAVVLIFVGLGYLGKIFVIPLVKASRPVAQIGLRQTDDYKVDRGELVREVEQNVKKVQLITETHAMAQQLVEDRTTVKAILTRMTNLLEEAHTANQIHAGTMEQLIRDHAVTHTALIRMTERLEHMPTTVQMVDGFKENRHDARNAIASLGLEKGSHDAS